MVQKNIIKEVLTGNREEIDTIKVSPRNSLYDVGQKTYALS